MTGEVPQGCVIYRRTDRGTGKNRTRCGDDGFPVHGDPVKIGVAGRTYRCKGILKDLPCRDPHLEADDIESAAWKELARLLEAEELPRDVAIERLDGLARDLNGLPGDKEKYEK
ncbi:hypothetical protein [Streptomyces sp. S.PB5]|uniref:hypothetical protein n=1 Tax=Streptomyces sp. S.PB5 TaxID=3020844 RepID=UPI0025B16184|nr:hypothetical protein [Streptomyces sp. S.PB5]MDN3023091.1 hypothetical protein [Streptomyces sp. S.PB5]